MIDEEVWKDVTGFPYYQASNKGRVKSLARECRTFKYGKEGVRRKKERILKPVPSKGYLVVGLCVEGHTTQLGIHQVVALAFFGLPPDGHVVDHLNCDKHDNRPENLEYVTNTENVLRQYRNGLLCNKGETHGGSKLTNAQVNDIRLLQGLETAEYLSSVYKVCSGHIKNIWAGRVRKVG